MEPQTLQLIQKYQRAKSLPIVRAEVSASSAPKRRYRSPIHKIYEKAFGSPDVWVFAAEKEVDAIED